MIVKSLSSYKNRDELQEVVFILFTGIKSLQGTQTFLKRNDLHQLFQFLAVEQAAK